MIRWVFLILQIVTSIISLYFLYMGIASDFAYNTFAGIIFFVFSVVFYTAYDTNKIKEEIEEYNRGLWSLDRKMDAILDELKKVKISRKMN